MGLQCDQTKEGMVNSVAKMDEFCKENMFSAWYETSAKENVNIDDAAKTLVSQVYYNSVSRVQQKNVRLTFVLFFTFLHVKQSFIVIIIIDRR